MTLLAGVLLRDLQFDGLVGMPQRGKQRGDGLADLEVDGTVFDLDDHVAVEFAVEGVEVVIAGARAIGLEVIPVEMIVVDEAAVEHHAPVRLAERGRPYLRPARGCGHTSKGHAAFRIRLDDKAGKVRNDAVNLITFARHQAATLGSSGSKVRK